MVHSLWKFKGTEAPPLQGAVSSRSPPSPEAAGGPVSHAMPLMKELAVALVYVFVFYTQRNIRLNYRE